MKTTIYLHFSNSRTVTEITTKNEATVGSIIKEYALKDALNPDYEEDLEVRIENSDDELSKDATLEKLKIKDGDHLNFSRCKKVAVSINYNGTTFQHNFGPSKTIDTVRKKALEHFHISEQDGASLSLFLTSACDEAIPGNEHIGSFTGYPTCGVTLFLAKKKEEYVTIHIDQTEYKTKAGKHSVAELKAMANIPLAYELEQLINGELIPLDDNAIIDINGCEIFFGHPRTGSSS
jgi:uncharacterized ubiquitin-like protein YukD